MKTSRWYAATLALVLLNLSVAAADEKANDALQPVPREGAWRDRHEKMNARVKQGNVDLIFIGDSITQGWEGAGRDVWQKHYDRRNAVNLGISGDRTQHVLWRLQNGNIEGISPKLAVIMIGTNNSGNNTGGQIAEGILAITSLLREKLPETKVLILAVFPRGANQDDPRHKVNQQANAIVAKAIESMNAQSAGAMVHFLDIGPKLTDEDGTISKDVMPDLLHLSPKGYALWAASIERSVAELMGEK